MGMKTGEYVRSSKSGFKTRASKFGIRESDRIVSS